MSVEHSIIGALLTDDAAYDRVSDRLRADMFSHPACYSAFQAIDALATDGKPFDTVAVLEWLEVRGRWTPEIAQEVGEMARNAVARNVVGHVEALEEQASRRRLRQMANQVAEQLEEGVEVEQIRQEAEQLLMTADRGAEAAGVKDILTRVIDDLDFRFNRGGEIVGLSTGYAALDQITSGLTITGLRSRARRFARKHGLGLIVVDYLQLMQGKGETRAQEVGNITRGLKALAKELQVPVIALSQLNRSLEKRPNKRPVMADLRESGDIEQDADLVMFIYRDEVYDEDSPDKGTAEIHIAKQRQGEVGTRRLTFLGRYCRFEDYVPRDVWSPPVDEPA